MSRRGKTARSGTYRPANPRKYAGRMPIVWRSTWELRVMQFFDRHPGVLKWASEPVAIPYTDPVTRRGAFYWPDFIVEYVDSAGRRHREIIEVKPAREAGLTEARDPETRAEIARNHAKWRAAAEWARRHRMGFRVLTEREIFGQMPGRGRKKARPRRHRRVN